MDVVSGNARRAIIDPPWVTTIRPPRYLVWRLEDHGGPKPAKVPYAASTPGLRASVIDPATWANFTDARRAYDGDPTLAGIGVVLVKGDPPLTAIDLDNAVTGDGTIGTWAVEIIRAMDTYTELSQSGRGVHLFAAASKPERLGTRSKITGAGADGTGGVEIYDNKRYVAITGWPVPGFECLATRTVEPRQIQLNDLCARLWPPTSNTATPQVTDTIDDDEAARSVTRLTAAVGAIEMAVREMRCRRYLAKLPEAISGQGGHDATFRAACEAFRFGLNTDSAWRALEFYNDGMCFPAWSATELLHKLRQARQAVIGYGDFGSRLTTPRSLS